MPGLMERYRERLPFAADDPVVSLGEGTTPLVHAPHLSELVGSEVWLKLEGLNPTGSFKDRGMTCAVSAAIREGAKAVICASTGNTAASAAAALATASSSRIMDRQVFRPFEPPDHSAHRRPPVAGWSAGSRRQPPTEPLHSAARWRSSSRP